MKTSIITFACLLGGAIASPVAAPVAESEVRTIVDVPLANHELLAKFAVRTAELESRDATLDERALLSGGGLGGGLTGGLTGALGGLNLNLVASLVTQVVQLVKTVEGTLAKSNQQGLDTLLPSVTEQLTVLNQTITGLQSATSGVSGTLYDVLNTLGLQALLVRLLRSVTQLFQMITTQIPADTPGAGALFQLLNQIVSAVGSLVDLSPLKPTN